MKTQEALTLIANEQAVGKTNEEIGDLLMNQDRIGTSAPTEKIIADLFELVQSAGAPGMAGEADNDAPARKAKKATGANYEEWKVEIDRSGKVVNKITKIKDVNITDAIADMLDASNMQGNGHAIRYIKK